MAQHPASGKELEIYLKIMFLIWSCADFQKTPFIMTQMRRGMAPSECRIGHLRSKWPSAVNIDGRNTQESAQLQ